MAKKTAPTKSAVGKDAEKDGKGDAGKPYVVFARRFRPQTFADVAGQAAVTGALRQALATGRLAQAYLLCGPRGVGKTSLARIFAKALNCLNGKGPNGIADEPCNNCDACEEIQNANSMDVVEMDAATNRGIEEMRSLRDSVGLSPSHLRFKVYIIDEVHMLTREAWNAFLKTLEEPPAHVKFVFATTDPNDVPETILSRCQRFDLRRIGPADIVKRLKQICEMEKVSAEEAALSRIASLSRGGLRDAEGLLDQAVNLGEGKVTDAVVRELSGAAPDELIFEMLKLCAAGDAGGVLSKAHQALEAGADPEDMLTVLIERLRETLLAKVCGANSPLLEGQAHLKTAYGELSGKFSEDQLMALIQIFSSGKRQMRDAAQTRLPLEMALIKGARTGELIDLGKLAGALEHLAPGGLNKPAGTPAQAPPNREGYRPNSPGRPVDSVDVRPAAPQNVAAPAPSASRPASGDSWARVIEGVRAQKGGAVLAGALTHAAAVQVDLKAGKVTLGFAVEQLFYRETLERENSRALLQTVLQEVFGREIAVVLERVSGGAATVGVKPVVSGAPDVAAPKTPSVSPPKAAAKEGKEGKEGDEPEYTTADELPLPEPPGDYRDEGTEVVFDAGDDDGAPAPAPRVQLPVINTPPPKQLSALDIKEVEQHPLVQMVLKQSEGLLLSVTRNDKKKAAPAVPAGQTEGVGKAAEKSDAARTGGKRVAKS